ncbi:transcription factor Ouib-like [Drosophila subpulchrella]|uniref:transcription factor Ouib-like n=1 Tax=Drosophila subpulchrella TaxID=1486046 RepID=UPI0018A153A6|nr:transcription factor Ouib-like [Drosophila subpulchrella]
MSPQCRLCLDIIYTKNAVNIFNGSKEIIVQIALLTGIWLKDKQNLPRNMCSCCLLSLKSAIAFREVCIKTNNRLSNNLKSVRTKDEEDVDNAYDPLPSGHKEAKMEKDIKDEEDDISHEEMDYTELEELEEDHNGDHYATDSGQEDKKILEDEGEKQKDEETQEDEEEALVDFDDDEEWTLDGEANSDTHDESGDDSDTEATIKSLVSEVVRQEPQEGISKGNSINSPKKSRNGENSHPKDGKRKRKKYQSTKIYVCDHCGKEFNDKGNLNLHVLRHTGIKPFACPECGKREFNKYSLNIHIRVKHRGEKPYACKYCELHFESSTKRTRHERRTHIKQAVKQKPFKCSSCNLRFEIRSQRTKHEKVHSGEREFQCKVCNVAFTRASNLKTHCKSKQHQRKEENSKTKTKS